jgi:GNAT superfamily N-acetyltransferase
MTAAFLRLLPPSPTRPAHLPQAERLSPGPMSSRTSVGETPSVPLDLPLGRFALRPAGDGDVDSVRDFLRALSPASSFARFFSPVTQPPPAFVRALVDCGPTRGAWLATPAAGHPCAGGPGPVVGHASWVRTGGTGQISVVVADDSQGMGLGRALVDRVLADLRRTPVDRLQLDVLASNRVVTAMIGRRWPGVRPDRDGTALTYLVPLR